MSAAQKLAEIRKALAALTAGVAVMVGAGLITGSSAAWLTGGLAAVGAAVAAWTARNADPAQTAADPAGGEHVAPEGVVGTLPTAPEGPDTSR